MASTSRRVCKRLRSPVGSAFQGAFTTRSGISCRLAFCRSAKRVTRTSSTRSEHFPSRKRKASAFFPQRSLKSPGVAAPQNGSPRVWCYYCCWRAAAIGLIPSASGTSKYNSAPPIAAATPPARPNLRNPPLKNPRPCSPRRRQTPHGLRANPRLRRQRRPALWLARSPRYRAELQPGAIRRECRRSASADDGVYSGQVCYGQTRKERQRCYRAEGTVLGGKITGQWLVAPEAGITMFLKGDVDASGGVTIEMHSQKPDGSPVATINLTGTLHDQTIDASGSFLMGRPATLNWRKTPGASE